MNAEIKQPTSIPLLQQIQEIDNQILRLEKRKMKLRLELAQRGDDETTKVGGPNTDA